MQVDHDFVSVLRIESIIRVKLRIYKLTFVSLSRRILFVLEIFHNRNDDVLNKADVIYK